MMAKARYSVGPTELSRFVRDYRERSGMTQGDLQAELDKKLAGTPLPDKYVSIVETGVRQELEVRFYDALAKVTGKTVEDLRELQALRPMSGRHAGRATATSRADVPRRVRLGCGHTVWGAPIIAAALEGRLHGIDVTTFADPAGGDGDLVSADDAVWITSGKWPVFPRDEKALRNKVPTTGTGRPLTAGDVLRWLNEGSIDIAAVPGGLVENNRDIMCIGRVVDSATGCMLVGTSKLKEALDSSGTPSKPRRAVSAPPEPKHRAGPVETITTRDLHKALTFLCTTLPDVRIAAEAGTVAWQFLEEACRESAGDESPIAPFELGWDCPNHVLTNRSLGEAEKLLRETQDGASLLGWITWEPHASWANARPASAGIGHLSMWPMQLSPNQRGRPNHFTFDLVILRSRSEDPLVGRCVYDLLWKTWQAASDLASLRSGQYHQHLKSLATYFGLGDKSLTDASEGLERMIAGVRFAVSFNLENQHEFPRG